jgi:hypothetical protein
MFFVGERLVGGCGRGTLGSGAYFLFIICIFIKKTEKSKNTKGLGSCV